VSQDNVVKLIQPGAFSDPLSEVLREGARALLAQAVEAEVAAFLGSHADKQTQDGRQRLVRHGHRPERKVVTGLGPVPVRAPRVRDRTGAGEGRIRFTSAILPPYARRSKSLEVLIPILYLKGISSGDFEDALAALLGKDAGGLSASSGYLRQVSPASRRPGRTSMPGGPSETSRPSATSISGSTASTCRPASKRTPSACS
jgi:putative transposase